LKAPGPKFQADCHEIVIMSQVPSKADKANGDFTASPELTAVICTYNRYEVLSDAIASLRAQSVEPTALEILVVDNSSDHVCRSEYWEGRTLPVNARLLINDKPGLSRARNVALHEARAPVIAYMDDDAIATPEWCASLSGVFKSRPDAGIVGGPVEPIWGAGSEPAWLHRWQRGFLSIVDFGEHFRQLEPREWLAGTNIAFRTEALRKVGGFDEGLGRIGSLLLSNEELVVARKIRELEFEAYYEPNARVMHHVRDSRATQRWLRQRACWQIVSDLAADNQMMEADQCWNELALYLKSLPVEMRGIRGLFVDTPDPDSFYLQCRALGALMHLTLNHADDPERT
jgi:GT2 family glycosyltransferase